MPRVFAALIILLLASCAQVVSPTGGPMDHTPPVALKYMPDSAGTMIRPSRITISFDEYVQLKDLQKEFVVSPSLKNTPDVTASGKTVTVKIKDTLEDNTTYIVDFGKSIADITEANSKPFRYVFSTGSKIDTVEYTGKIQNSMNGKPDDGFTIMLYKNMADSAPYKEKPYYYTKSNSEGIYHFKNLKPGPYRVFALKDGNGNFMPDPDEAMAFIPDPVHIDSLTTDTLKSFIEAPFKTYLKKTEIPFPGKILLIYSKSIGDVKLTFPNNQKSVTIYKTDYSNEKDSVTIWYKNALSDSILFISTSSLTTDTIEKKLSSAKGKKEGNQLTISSSDISNSGFIYKDDPVFFVSAPLERVDTMRIRLDVSRHKDTTVIATIDTTTRKSFFIRMKFDKDSSNRITFYPGALRFFNDKMNDTLKYSFTRRSTDGFGTLLLKLENVKTDGILELLNETGVVKSRMYISADKENSLFVSNLEPGNYSARLIKDTNSNRKWDTGNYIQKRQPEEVIFLNKGLLVKAGWDLEETWKIE